MVRTAFYWAPFKVETPHTKDTGSPSAATPAGASTATADKSDKPTEKAPPGDISGRESTAKPTEKPPPGNTSERNSAAEDERAAFQRLQASVAENAQVCHMLPILMLCSYLNVQLRLQVVQVPHVSGDALWNLQLDLHTVLHAHFEEPILN